MKKIPVLHDKQFRSNLAFFAYFIPINNLLVAILQNLLLIFIHPYNIGFRRPSGLYFHSPQVLNGVVYHLIYLVTRPIIIHYGHPVCHLRMIKHKTLLRPGHQVKNLLGWAVLMWYIKEKISHNQFSPRQMPKTVIFLSFRHFVVSNFLSNMLVVTRNPKVNIHITRCGQIRITKRILKLRHFR